MFSCHPTCKGGGTALAETSYLGTTPAIYYSGVFMYNIVCEVFAPNPNPNNVCEGHVKSSTTCNFCK